MSAVTHLLNDLCRVHRVVRTTTTAGTVTKARRVFNEFPCRRSAPSRRTAIEGERTVNTGVEVVYFEPGTDIRRDDLLEFMSRDGSRHGDVLEVMGVDDLRGNPYCRAQCDRSLEQP